MALKDLKDARFLAALFVFALIETLIATGVIYGWANMVFVYKVERFYLHLCPWLTNDQNITTNVQEPQQGNFSGTKQLPHCPAQDSMFNLIFTISAKCFGIAMLPGGILIDKHGPFVASVLCGAFFVMGALGLSFTSVGYEPLLFPVFIFFGLGGNLQAGCLFKVCNVAFERRKSLVLCVLNGALDTSAVIFVIFKVLYDSGYGFQQISLLYAGVCAAVVVSGLIFFIPPQPRFQQWIASQAANEVGDTTTRTFDHSEEGSENTVNHVQSTDRGNINIYFVPSKLDIPNATEDVQPQSLELHGITNIGFDGIAVNTDVEILSNDNLDECTTGLEDDASTADDSLRASVCSTLYIIHIVFLCTSHLKLVYFVGSLSNQLTRLSNNVDDTISWYINVFGYVQLGGLVFTPFLGVLFDRDTFGTRAQEPEEQIGVNKERQQQRKLKQCIAPIAVTILLSLTLCVLALFENIALQIPQYIIYTVVRGFLYSCHSAYIAVAFPDRHFGTLLGLGFFCTAIFSLLNYALFELMLGPFGGDSLYTNVILVVLVSCSAIHPLNIWLKVK